MTYIANSFISSGCNSSIAECVTELQPLGITTAEGVILLCNLKNVEMYENILQITKQRLLYLYLRIKMLLLYYIVLYYLIKFLSYYLLI